MLPPMPPMDTCEYGDGAICCPGMLSLASGASEFGGYFMPFFGDAEQGWPKGLRAVLYFFGLVWCCTGVAIIADLFMGAIEEVTTKVTIKVDKEGNRRVQRFWNPTIANLSLLALGSSAPEIMLNVIEILLGKFYAGELGPSTIVGSAAFNLLVIIAVCVLAITEGVRTIEGTEVYMLTASCSVFAYVWLLIILVANSPDIVTVAEAVMTFVFFWLLLIAAFIADKKCFRDETKKQVSPEAEEAAHKSSLGRQATMKAFVSNTSSNPAETKQERREQVKQVGALGKIGRMLSETAMDGVEAAEKLALMIQAIPQKATGATHKRNILTPITGKKAKPTIDDMDKATKAQGGKSIKPAGNTPRRSAESMKLGEEGLALFAFKEEAIDVIENAGKATLVVMRRGYTKEAVTVEYKTFDISAVEGKDYKGAEGTLNFAAGETEKTIEIEIIDDDTHEANETFRVELSEPSDGATLDEDGDGTQAVVTIVNDDDDGSDVLDKAFNRLSVFGNRDKLAQACDQYKEQFTDAIKVPREEGEPITIIGVILHCITVFWKVIFATVPPTSLAGGWLAFFVALGYIAVMTMLIADLANFFGCVIGLPAATTAITFVALGTSMPDLFASVAAAQSDDTADNSVGNVTGSNCVNVFLGLGLPWMIAAIYWSTVPTDGSEAAEWVAKYATEGGGEYSPHVKKYWDEKGELAFVVRAGDLGLSVIIFCNCALTAVFVLYLRRKLFGGELGGPKVPRYMTAVLLVIMWLIYLIISALKTDGKIDFDL
jgi:Ca2+/Na+ antiporter